MSKAVRVLVLSIVAFLLLTPVAGQSAFGSTIYVKEGATGAGLSWADAYGYLQDALDDAISGDEIWVAAGTYKPDASSFVPAGSGDRNATFQLINGVAVYGGFAGRETTLGERDWQANETILSGDLNNDDVEFSNPENIWSIPNRSDNSEHVVTSRECNETAVVNGFTITAGYNTGRGAGMYNYNSSPTVTNCTFDWNIAEWGAGMGNQNSSSPKVTDCKFENNTADGGGGMDNWSSSNPILVNCTFSNNFAFWRGGGMIADYAGGDGPANPTLINCIFSNNLTDGKGGGIYNNSGSPIIVNCTFNNNSAEYGGAIYIYRNGNPKLANCILYGDTGVLGSEIYIDFYSESQPTATTVSYSNVQGGSAGVFIETGSTLNWEENNINTDPLFADPFGDDCHLKSEGWRWDSGRSIWTWDEITSACIDAGNPGSPLGDELLSIPGYPDNPYGENIRINMGSYGGTAEASMPPYGWALLGDLTNDGTVNVEDCAGQAADWLETAEQQPGDLNRDGIVNINDFAMLAKGWLTRYTARYLVIDPVTGVTVSSDIGPTRDRVDDHIVDCSGLTAAQHSSVPDGNMWLSSGIEYGGQDSDPSVTFDLGAVYTISRFHVWNYNQAGYTTRGINSVSIEYGTTASLGSTVAGITNFAQATGADGYTGEEFDMFTPFSARYIKFDINSNHGDVRLFYGLSEVRFYNEE